VDSIGRLWMASARSGLLRVDRPTDDRPVVRRYTTADGLSSNLIGAVLEDRQRRIYAGTARAIDRLDPDSGRITSYPTSEGLPTGEIHAGHRDRQGALWFGCHNGLYRLIPPPDRAPAPPSLLITSLIVNGQPQPIAAVGEARPRAVEIPPGPSAMHVEYGAPGFGAADRIDYQIMLEGLDRGWSAPTVQRTARYANIGAGTYRFQVRAVTGPNVTSAVAGFELTVLAPVWKRWWFLGLAAAAFVAAGHTAYRYRLGRIMDIARMRERIASDLHDDIGANLTRIAILSEVVRRERSGVDGTVDQRLASIASVARQSITAMSDIVWAISPDRDSLDELTGKMREYAEEMFGPAGVPLEFTALEGTHQVRLGAEVRRDVYLAFKEAINNAARHSACSRATVHVAGSGRGLTVTVTDNGRGFDPAVVAEGNGLANMRRRSARLDGGVSVTSAQGKGTTVVLHVASRRARRRPHDRVADKIRGRA
jgi:signal transduction histidine kinase